MKIRVNNISFCVKSMPVMCLEEYNKQPFLKNRHSCLEEKDIGHHMILEKKIEIFSTKFLTFFQLAIQVSSYSNTISCP